jgi:hypothetical protein
VEIVSNREKGQCPVRTALFGGETAHELVVNVGGEFLELELGEAGKLLAGGCSSGGGFWGCQR